MDHKRSKKLSRAKNRHIVLHLSVVWAVDQMMLVKWMPLESRWALLTLYKVTWSKVKVQLLFFEKCLLNISWRLRWKVPKLSTVDPPSKLMTTVDFQVKMVKGQGQNAGLCTNAVRSISFDPFAWKSPNLVQWMPLKRGCSLLMFTSQGQRLMLVLTLSAVDSISYDPLISIDIKKVKLWIKVNLSTAKHRNAEKYFCHQPTR